MNYKLQLSVEVRGHLQKLKEKTEVTDLGELFRRALTTYDALYDEVVKGGKIFVHKHDGSKKEVLLV
jgi:hypothetical protein